MRHMARQSAQPAVPTLHPETGPQVRGSGAGIVVVVVVAWVTWFKVPTVEGTNND